MLCYVVIIIRKVQHCALKIPDSVHLKQIYHIALILAYLLQPSNDSSPPKSHSLQISSLLLLPLNRLEETLEISRSKPIESLSLNDFQKDRRTIHQRFCEELQ